MARPVKLYNHSVAPNPRRVRIFAAEKGIELALEEIDILAGQSRIQGAFFVRQGDYWKALGISIQGCLFALTGKASDAVQMITSGSAAYRSTGATWFAPTYLSHLARAYAGIGQFDDALRCLREATNAIDTTGERWFEAEVYRTAGEITLKSPQADTAKAQVYFERALAIACQQQAKSWELRAAMSIAQLWREQGKAQQARELLVPVYGWFTEGLTRAI